MSGGDITRRMSIKRETDNKERNTSGIRVLKDIFFSGVLLLGYNFSFLDSYLGKSQLH